MKTVVLSSGNAAKLNVLDFQMSSINAFGDLPIRRALGTGK